MGNSLNCEAPNVTSAVGLLGQGTTWNCSGTTVLRGGGSCRTPFMVVPENGTNRVFSQCVSFQETIPPGFDNTPDVMSAFGVNSLQDGVMNAFWCAKVPTVGWNTTFDDIGLCDCVPSEGTEKEEKEKDMTWLLGVLFSILSSICTTVGTLLQKIAHRINDAKPEGQKAYELGGILLSPAWLCAFLLMVLLPLPFDFVALALAAQSLLVVFAGLTIALNLFMAQLMLGEKPDRIEVIATVVILIGLVLATAGGSKEDVNFSVCEILSRYSDIDFLVGVFSLSLSISIALYLIHFAKQTHLITRIKPVLFALCAGGFGGLGNIVFKATGELAESGLASGDKSKGAWSTIHPYYHIVLIIFFATLQIMHINQGLRRYDAVLFVPLYNCMYIILSGSMGALTYKEFQNYTTMQFVLFPCGVAITLVGILIMTQKEPDSSSSDIKVTPANEVSKATSFINNEPAP